MAGVMLVCAAARYLVSFTILQRPGASSRNLSGRRRAPVP
jgi:hypothetical protein